MRILILPLAGCLIGASEPEAPAPKQPATPQFQQTGCAEAVPNFNWEVCQSAQPTPPECVEKPELLQRPAVQSEAPITRDSYDPENDAPMEMRAVHRTEDGCPVIELTSGETVPVPEAESAEAAIPEG